MDDAFGELRSLMNMDEVYREDRARLWGLLDAQSTHDPEAFASRWLPYLEGFPRHMGVYMTEVLGLEELEQVASRVPVARFKLTLAYSDYDAARAAELAASPWAANVGHLNLNRNAIGDAGARALAESPHLRHVSELHLGHNGVGPDGAIAWAESENLSPVFKLYIADNQLGDEGAIALARSRHLDTMSILKMSDNGIGPVGAAALANAPGLSGLSDLGLSNNPIGREGERALASSPYLSEYIRGRYGT